MPVNTLNTLIKRYEFVKLNTTRLLQALGYDRFIYNSIEFLVLNLHKSREGTHA